MSIKYKKVQYKGNKYGVLELNYKTGKKAVVMDWKDFEYIKGLKKAWKCNNSDLVVKCIPELPDHVNIDEMNNLHVYLKIGFAGILSISDISFSLGGRNFNIPVNELLVKDNQLYYLKNCGISRINEDSVYDDSRRSHIIVHIDFI